MRRFALALLLILLPAHGGEPAGEQVARIVACYDGDTCRLDRAPLPGRDRVRIANIDAPELAAGAECLAERLLAQLARAETARLLAADGAGPAVTLTDISPDKYPKRIDARVLLADGRDLGQALIAAGVAVPWTGKRVDWCR